MSDSVQPWRRQPTRLPRPWDSPGKNTGVGCHFLLQCMKVKSEVKWLSCVRLLGTPWTAAYQAPPPMGFSRQDWVAIVYVYVNPNHPIYPSPLFSLSFPPFSSTEKMKLQGNYIYKMSHNFSQKRMRLRTTVNSIQPEKSMTVI